MSSVKGQWKLDSSRGHVRIDANESRIVLAIDRLSEGQDEIQLTPHEWGRITRLLEAVGVLEPPRG